jgi:NADPH2:quinone reductase
MCIRFSFGKLRHLLLAARQPIGGCRERHPRPASVRKRFRALSRSLERPLRMPEASNGVVPLTMRAAINTAGGGPEVLAIEERPVPTPARDEVLVRVVTSGLNRADLLQRAGRYPAPPGWPADIPGLEFAGEVVACGATVQRWRSGDRVFGLVGGGAHAQYLVAHERAVAAIPASLGWEQAGVACEAFITAHDALVTQAALRPGESVLIHAVGSGVALAAVQLIRALGGTSYGSARGASKITAARELGLANGVVAENVASIAPAVMEWTRGRGVDVVLDLVGGDYVAASVASLAMRGRLMLVGSLAGRAASLDLGTMLSKRLTVRGTSLRARPLEERILATQAFEREVVPWLANGTLSTRIDGGFSLSDIAKAHARLESNDTIGKIVLDIGAQVGRDSVAPSRGATGCTA